MAEPPAGRPEFEWDDEDLLPGYRPPAPVDSEVRPATDDDTSPQPDLTFTAKVVEWRGPAPFHFLVAPEDARAWLASVMKEVTYGWGMIPVTGVIGDTEFTTSIWPRQGAFYVPLKDAVREAEGIGLGDTVTVGLTIRA